MRPMAFARSLLLVLLTSGCALAPGAYPSFDGWAIGEPDVDYDDRGLEAVPAARMVYGPLLAVPYATRDIVRAALAPLVFPYFAARGSDAVPGSAFVGPRPPVPPDDEPREVSYSLPGPRGR